MWSLFNKQPDIQKSTEKFLSHYKNKSIILHQGLEQGWLDELFKLPGGPGYFRIDSRTLNKKAPISHIIQQHILPLDLPMPCFIHVEETQLTLRHLTQRGKSVHPSDIQWFIDELDTRHHYRIALTPPYTCTKGIDISDNDALSMLESF